MIAAGRTADGKGIPVIFDAVGMGATPFQSVAAAIMGALTIDVVKGNASEIAFPGRRRIAMQRRSRLPVPSMVADADTVRVIRNGHEPMGVEAIMGV